MAVVKELLARFRGDTKDLERSTDRAKRSVNEYGNSAERANSKVEQSFLNAGKAATVAAAAFAAVKVINRAEDYALLRSRIEGATESVEEATFAFNQLAKISNEVGTELNTAVDIFQRLSFTRKEINATVEEMVEFTSTVQKLGVVSGASTGALNAGLLQLGQALSSDVTRAEEFNSILENIPAVAKAIADEFGVTTGQLRNLVIEGEVASKDVFAAILNSTQKANEEFEKLDKTIKRTFSGLLQSVDFFVEKFLSIIPINKAIIALMESLSNVLRGVAQLGEIIGLTFQGAFVQARIYVDDFVTSFLELQNKVFEFFNSLPGNKLQIALNDTKSNGMELRKELDEISRSLGVAVANFSKLDNETKKTSSSTEKLSKDYKDIASSLSGANEEKEKSADNLSKISDGLKDNQRELDRFSNSTASTFAQFVSGTISARQALNSLANDIAQFVLRETVTSPLKAGLSNALGSITGLGSAGSGFAFGGSSTSISASGAPIPGVKPTVASFNSGGSFQVRGTAGNDRNTLSLNGQPISNVSKGETVNIGRGGGGGVTINQNLNFSLGVQETVRAEIAQLAPQISRQTQRDVLSSLKRGGALAREVGTQSG